MFTSSTLIHVFPIFLSVYIAQSHSLTCGSHSYDPNAQICCAGNVHRLEYGPGCCGNRYYDPNQHVCCSGQIRDTVNGFACCGAVNYA